MAHALRRVRSCWCTPACTSTRPRALADWHLPLSHVYEQWGDALAHDGSATLLQPAISPLYDTRSAAELLALLADDACATATRWCSANGAPARGGDFDAFWRDSLRAGVVAGSAAPPLALARRTPAARPRPDAAPAPRLVALFVPDAAAHDGAFANNGWLQELPRPFTKLTWDNALLLSPATAARLGVATGDVVRRAASTARVVEAPVWVLAAAGRRRRHAAARLRPARAPAASATASASTPTRCGPTHAITAPVTLQQDRPHARVRGHAARDRPARPRARCARVAAGAGVAPKPAPQPSSIRRSRARCTPGRWRSTSTPASAATPAPSPARPRTTSRSSARSRSRKRPRDALDPRRPLRPATTIGSSVVPAGALHALRRGAVRGRLPGRRHRARQRRPQRAGLQPLRRHALLLQQLPVQGAALQLPAVRATRPPRR